MTKSKEPTMDELVQQVKQLTEKVEALENKTEKSKKQKSDIPRKPSKYALFIKDNYSQVKKDNPDAKMGEISKIIAKMWKEKDV